MSQKPGKNLGLIVATPTGDTQKAVTHVQALTRMVKIKGFI